MVRKNPLLKSGNSWKMPLKALNIPFSNFKPYEYYQKNDPKTASIIFDTLAQENKAEGWFLYQYWHYITDVSPRLLPLTLYERYWEMRPTAPKEAFQYHLDQIKYLMGEIQKWGYDSLKPVYTVAKYWHYEPIGWFIILDGGHHRLQSVRELIHKKRLPVDFEIPTLVSWDRKSVD